MVDSDEEALLKQKEELASKSLYPDAQIITMKFDIKGANQWSQYQVLCDQIKEVTKEKEMSILVNNAEEFDPFGPKIHRAKDEEVLGNLTINTFPMIFMTRFLGPDLK